MLNEIATWWKQLQNIAYEYYPISVSRKKEIFKNAIILIFYTFKSFVFFLLAYLIYA